MAAPIAPVPQHRSTTTRARPAPAHGLRDQERRALPGHEHAGIDGDPQAAELRPAEQRLQRRAVDPRGGEGVELGGRQAAAPQQPRLVLGEHAARRAQAGDEWIGTGTRWRPILR